jgi:sugar phosphate isomerase/epimerase
MSQPTLPTLGAAMPIDLIGEHRDWLLEHGGRDLEIQDGFRADVLDGDWKPVIQKARDALEGHAGRVGIHGPFDGLHIGSWDAAVRAFVAARYLKALDFVEALTDAMGQREPHLVMHSPFLFFGHPQVAHTPATGLQDQIKWVHHTLEPVVSRASSLGCTIVIENIRDTNPQPLLALVKSFDSKFVRLSLDTGHANLMREIGGPNADQWVRDAGSWLGHVHLQDNDGMLDHHWQPGKGSINWFAVMTELRKLETRPRLILEVRNTEVRPAAIWLASQGLAR